MPHESPTNNLAGRSSTTRPGKTQCRCLAQQGECERALECLEEIVELPDSVVHFRKLKTKALNVALACVTDDSQKKYRRAIQTGNDWLKQHGEEDPESADWLEFRYRLARAYLLAAEEIDDAEQKNTLSQGSRTLADYVARRDGEYPSQARAMLADGGAPAEAHDPQ